METTAAGGGSGAGENLALGFAAAGAEVVLCGELDSEGLTPTAVVREGQVKLL